MPFYVLGTIKMKIELTSKMQEIAEFFEDLGSVYFVGGCIRDILLGVEPHDYDLITPYKPETVEVYMKSKGKRVLKVGKRFGTLSCKVGKDNDLVEVTTFRKEIYDFESRKPIVEFTEHLEQDLERRDFTINAISCNMQGIIKDPKGGREDLEHETLRAVGNPKMRFKEDPLRILRGFRFKGKYSLRVSEKTADKLESCRWELLRLSKERIIDELNKILLLDTPFKTKFILNSMLVNKIFQIILPQLHLQYEFDQNNPHHKYPLHSHTFRVVAAVKESEHKNSLPHLWSALLHDIGKPFTQTLHKSGERCNYISHEILGAEIADDFCRKYKFSNVDREFIVKSVLDHIQIDSWLKPYDNKGK